MNDLVGRFPTVDGLSDQIGKAKVEAAQVMETTLGRLDDAFITPLDREDIMQLITDIYDVIEGAGPQLGLRIANVRREMRSEQK
jgi:uncharacterized protein